VNPHPHIRTRHEVPVAVVAEAVTVFPINPDTLAHGNLPGKGNVTVAEFRMLMIYLFCFRKEHGYPLPC
jgi:hypothetical protein